MHFLAKDHVMPIMTDVSQTLIAFVIGRTVVTSLIRPFGHKFKVTAKGLSSTDITVQWRILWRFAALAALTLAGMLLFLPAFSTRHGLQGYSLNIFWSLVNIAILVLVCMACVELPKRRRDERFTSNEQGLVCLEGGIELPCTVEDISLGGACVTREEGWRDLVGPAALVLDYGRLVVPFDVVRRMDRKLALTYRSTPQLRRALIVKLFTGEYHHDVEQIQASNVFRSLVRALAC
jgi:cellulose synthase (UDP-forming)